MQNLTNVYWNPPSFLQPHRGLKQIDNYGFLFKLPHPSIQTAGFYYGENPGYGRRELVYSDQPEYYAVDNTIPSSGGLPMVNLKNPYYSFKRSSVTKKI